MVGPTRAPLLRHSPRPGDAPAGPRSPAEGPRFAPRALRHTQTELEDLDDASSNAESNVTVAYSLQKLRSNVDGRVLTAGDTEYDAARRVYNGMIDKRPGVIVRCSGVCDVREAVLYARSNNLRLAVRGSGHNVAGLGTIDGHVLALLSSMDGVRVNPGHRRARAAAGATWRILDRETQVFGLATTGGIVHDTGIAGLTLGGGLGWLMGKLGLTCDNLTAVDLVTADAAVVVADDVSHPDLMWALRGGGGNFGIVTSFEYRLHPVGPVSAGSIRIALSNARAALSGFADFAIDCPDEITVSPALYHTDAFGRHLSLDYCSLLEPDDTRRALRKLSSSVAVLEMTLERKAYCDWQLVMSDPYRRGRRSYWKSVSLQRLTGEIIDELVAGCEQTPSDHTLITIDHLHGQAARVDPNATAYGLRLPFVVLINTNWTHEADDRENISWARELFDRLESKTTEPRSAYVNYLGVDDSHRLRDVYQTNLDRLQRLKADYDPDNFFSVNHNITPSQT
jgi:FAD/FMN-containing dehydrogenase